MPSPSRGPRSASGSPRSGSRRGGPAPRSWPARVARERRLSLREVWRRDRLRGEAQRAGLDPETVTVAHLVEALGGTIRDWRPASVRPVVPEDPGETRRGRAPKWEWYRVGDNRPFLTPTR